MFLCAFPAHGFAANGSGVTKTVMLGPNSLVNTAPLDFGNIIRGTAGNVTVNAQTDARTTTGPLLAGGTPTAARFVGSGTPNTIVTVSISPSPIVLTSGANSMTANQLRISVNGGAPQPLGPNQNLGPIGVINFGIGGRLVVAATQAFGTYSGSFSLTMNYQ